MSTSGNRFSADGIPDSTPGVRGHLGCPRACPGGTPTRRAGAHGLSDIDYRSCAQVFARLDDWVDRELAADDMAQIERHLEICAMCASEFRLEGPLLRTVRGKLRRLQLPAGLEGRVWQALNAAARERIDRG